jgi:dihydrofolate reductase
MKCSVYIATSADGFIAKPNGNIDWLMAAGNKTADMGDEADMGFNRYISSVDCMVMGRKCMEVVAAMNLTDEQWPYGDTRIVVLSDTLKEAPASLKGRVEMYSGDIKDLMVGLEQDGFNHAYIDGGMTIQAFINLELINEMTITRAPILLGEGIPLFGKTAKNIMLEQSSAKGFVNDFIQEFYKVNYS